MTLIKYELNNSKNFKMRESERRMHIKIAVFTHNKFKNDASTTILRAIVFERNAQAWNEYDSYYVNIKPDGDLLSVREEIKKLIASLADCRVAVGSQFSGVLYRELDNSGFSIFETQDFSPETLDGILRDLEEARTEEAITAKTPTCPVETQTPGVFYLDLLELHEASPEMSSKQALREFLETTPFYELRLKCAHIPLWLEAGPYEITTEAGVDCTIATVRKKQFGGG
jgi:hypothetical protein